MDKQTPLELFTQTIKNPSLQCNIFKSLVSHFQIDINQESTPLQETFIYQCVDFIGQETQDQSCRFQAIMYTYPALIDRFESFKPEIQDAIRSGLLNAAVARYTNIKAMGALGLLVREIAELDNKVKDGFNEWVEPIGQLIKWTGSEESGTAQAGVQFLIYFFKETPFNSSNSQIPIYKLAHPLLQTLFQVFTSAPQDQKTGQVSLRQKILYLVLQVIKSFSFYDGSDDSIVKQCLGDNIQLWASLFASILKSTVTSHLGLKKYALKILIVIYRDMQNLCQNRLKNLNSQVELLGAWQFAYKFIPVYLSAQCWRLTSLSNEKINNKPNLPYFDDDYDSNLNPAQAIAHNILELLSVLSSSSLLRLVVKISIYHIINALFHYCLLTVEDLATWNCNYLHFVSTVEHECIRGKVLAILNDIIEKHGDYAIQALLLIAQKFLMNHKQTNTVEIVTKIVQSMNIKEIVESGKTEISLKVQDILKFTVLSGCDIRQTLNVSGQTWRKSEVALSVLGRFSQDIIVFQSRQQAAFDIQNFVKGVIKQFQVQDFDISTLLLKGQSLYCLTRFTEIVSIRYKDLFPELVTSCSICVSENYPTAIRVAACKSLTIFFRKVQKHKLKLSQEQISIFESNRVSQGIMTIEITSQTNNYVLQALIQLIKCLGPQVISQQIAPLYLLENIHKNIMHPNTLKICFNFLQILCQTSSTYEKMALGTDENGVLIIPHFISDCLQTYLNIVKSEQKNYLKAMDINLITAVLKLANIVLQKCPSESINVQTKLIGITPLLTEIVKFNQNLSIHVACTICLKNLIRLCPALIKQKKYQSNIVEAIHSLLKVPSDKTFQGASVYVGNLILLTFQFLLEKPDQQIMQEVVLKVFKSRTPSVIQSLVLTYSRVINSKTEKGNPFGKGEWESKLKNIIDFLASFSIQNRMGLKILVDKWLLQQSLFRGNFTKISTFMALSKMFLLRDKRIDNLLVIGFNPSHVNVNNDVNAPLKILATLIRCLHNQIGEKEEENEQEESINFQLKQSAEGSGLDVGLQKFKQTEQNQNNQVSGGLADRENQQGSTCYMTAMLEFYDDGEQCDETTDEDLLFLKDSSTKFSLSEYLTDFFLHLNSVDSPNHQYFIECLRQILKQDLKILQKYIKVTL